MSYIARHRINASLSVSGGASQSFYTDVVNGYLEAVRYRRGTTGTTASGISTGAKIVLTAEETGAALLTIATASADAMSFYPRAAAQDVSGGVLSYASGVTPPYIPTRIPVGGERIKVKVTSGGSASTVLHAVFDLYLSGV